MPENKDSEFPYYWTLTHPKAFTKTTYRRIRRCLSFRRGVFGQKLEDTIRYEKRYGDKVAPMIVEQCVGFIRKQGLQEVGLFRLPGQANLVKDLQDAFDAGEKPTFDSNTDVHTVASLLKLYLRELPEPVIPFSKYEDFLLCAKLLTHNKEEGLEELKRLLKDLSAVNLNLLQYICRFLDEVQSYSNVNKMSIRNLATVFGPNILRPKVEDPETIIGGTALVQQLMAVMISEHSKLFPREILPNSGLTEQSPAGKVLMTSVHSLGKEEPYLKQEAHVQSPHMKALTLPLRARTGLAKNLQQGGVSTHPLTGTNQPACRCQSSSMEKSRASTEGNDKAVSSGDLKSHVYDNYCFRLTHEGEATIHTLLKETDTGSTGEQNGSFPNSQTASGSKSNKQKSRSAKENRVGYACASKLSVYDNVDFVPLLNSDDMNNTDCVSWSNLSCELLHGDNSGSHYSSRTTCPDDTLDLNLFTPTISGFSDNFLFGAGNSSSSGIVISTNDNSLNQSVLQCLIDLRQQMIKQKEEYESRIKSLEQRNQYLEHELHDLQSSLEQQRKWFNIVEIKMRNAERAREDAEKRNEKLQMEMEEFFDTFGELTNEVKKTEKIVQSF
ncbi:rho GTPase-activating protein 24-like isoform X2 [Protopterus annectens]|uniref:rho GTPase-activating protein 24-like isoform X2 n=1 Tax=Protopterus annectens TaxID=7888 RepID=UPI001CFC3EFC|nr:rho GTPase-activating protein 24-like isoform X2 [Protopterus annectens]